MERFQTLLERCHFLRTFPSIQWVAEDETMMCQMEQHLLDAIAEFGEEEEEEEEEENNAELAQWELLAHMLELAMDALEEVYLERGAENATTEMVSMMYSVAL